MEVIGYLQEFVVLGRGGNGFKLKENRLRSDSRKKILYHWSGKASEQVEQRSCGCPMSGNI